MNASHELIDQVTRGRIKEAENNWTILENSINVAAIIATEGILPHSPQKISTSISTNSYRNINDLVNNAGNLTRLKGGVRQGNIIGNANDIFNKLAKQYGANIEKSGKELFFKSGNVRVGLHNSSKGGGTSTIHINDNGQTYKIRVYDTK